jgi:hypothetical protein
MVNLCEINRTGLNLHIWLRLRPRPWLKVLLVLGNLAFVPLWLGLMVALGEGHHQGQLLVGFALSLILWAFTLGRFSLWQLFGEEYLVINRQSISFQYRFGLFQTHLRTHKLHRPLLHYELTHPSKEGIGRGIFHILQQGPDHPSPQPIYRSTIEVNEQDLKAVIAGVSDLQLNECNEKYGFTELSMN